MSRYSFSMPSHAGRKGWFRVGELEITTTAIMVGLGIISMFVYAVDKVTFLKGAYLGSEVRGGELWRLATWPLVNPPNRIWVIVTLAFFWFVGHRIEDEIGRVRFLILVGLTSILAGAVVTAFTLTAATGIGYGLSIPGFALLVIIAIQSPQQPWFFGIPIWILVAVYAAVDVLGLVGDRLWGILLLQAASVVLMTLGAAVYGLIDILPFLPRVGAARPAGARRSKRRRGGRKGSGTVTQGPWSSPSGFDAPGPSRLEQAELDVLLDKIGQSGIGSLSAEERRRLDELSRRMRGT